MKALALVALIFSASPLAGNQTIFPPVTAATFVGTWEALFPAEIHPPTLWHMEISAAGNSYLAQITVGTSCIVRRLVASEIKDGVVKLHYAVGRQSSRGLDAVRYEVQPLAEFTSGSR